MPPSVPRACCQNRSCRARRPGPETRRPFGPGLGSGLWASGRRDATNKNCLGPDGRPQSPGWVSHRLVPSLPTAPLFFAVSSARRNASFAALLVASGFDLR